MPSTQTEIKFLRAEVRALRQHVAQLESELAFYEAEEDQEFQALWPYRWIVGGLEKTRHCFHSFQLRDDRKIKGASQTAPQCAERQLGTI